MEHNTGAFAEVTTGRMCAGTEYPAVVHGEQDFALFWRTLPWDHAPGALLVEVAGGVVRRLDGDPYRPAEVTRTGLLAARDEATWETARRILD